MNEYSRLLFIEQRDGKQAAIDWAVRTMRLYRTAVLTSKKRGFEKPHHASFREYRREFIESYCQFKQYVSENNEIECNLPWEPGTDEHKNPETNVIYLVDEPEINS